MEEIWGNEPSFVIELQNICLGFTFDQFNQFGNITLVYSIWYVVFIVYNSSLWMYMKQPNMSPSLFMWGLIALTITYIDVCL